MGYSAEKSNWVNPNIEFVFNSSIIEYDLKDAGMTIIQGYKLLPENIIQELLRMDKLDRHIAVGKMQGKDKRFSESLLNKFTELRSLFISSNSLTDNDIISVKKDAIYTIGNCKNTIFGNVKFVPKNRYSSYLRFTDNMGIEIYYNDDGLDIKKMGETAINTHRLYMMDFIRQTIYLIERKDLSIRRYLKQFIDRYKHQKLDTPYYIEFNNLSREFNPAYNYHRVIVPLVGISIKEVEQ